MGFSVRKRYTNRSTIDGVVTSCKFVCFKEGKKAVDKRDSLTKKGRAEIRTDCEVHMSITVDREDGRYEIFHLDGETEDTPAEGDDEENGSSLLKDFSACMYEYDDPETFEEAFKLMRCKLKKQTWMDSIYKVKRSGHNVI